MKKDDRKLEEFVSRLMKDHRLEEPSQNFTANVMREVLVHSKSKSVVYKPLIPKSVWVGITTCILVLLAVVYFIPLSSEMSLFNGFKFPDFPENPVVDLSYNFSKTFMYAAILFAIMLSIQIPVLKHYFNKRMAF